MLVRLKVRSFAPDKAGLGGCVEKGILPLQPSCSGSFPPASPPCHHCGQARRYFLPKICASRYARLGTKGIHCGTAHNFGTENLLPRYRMVARKLSCKISKKQLAAFNIDLFNKTGLGEGNAPQTQAFTLLEVILSLAILASLMSGVAMLLKNSSEVKTGVSEAGNVNHRLQVAMEKISRDLAHAFMVRKTDFDRNTKAIFRIERHDNSDRLFLTTITHRPKKINSKESDMTYVIYEVRKDEDGRPPTHLYRGETARVPESFRDEVETVMLARAVKSLQLITWNGDKWSEDSWHSNRGEHRNKLPHLVRIELEAYETVELEGKNVRWEEAAVVSLKSAVFNHFATNFAQVKRIGAPLQWY